MHRPQRTLARELLQSQKIDCALFAHPHSVAWLSGFVAPMQLGANPFAGAAPLIWYADGQFTLIVVDSFAGASASFGAEPDCRLIIYGGYSIEQPIDGLARLGEALRRMWKFEAHAHIAIERADVSSAISALLSEANPHATVTACDGWLQPLRQVKHPEEIAKLRENFKLTDIAHRAARIATLEGAREIDVWTAAHSAVQQTAGCRVPFGNDCVVGYRQANIGGWPLDYPLRAGDSLIADFSTVQVGYWSDSCETYYAGVPDPRQQELRAICVEALALGASLLKPGAVARDVDMAMRAFMARSGQAVYPHHSGHGVGLSGHEAPRIVPYSDETLVAGMVVMLEPGIYLPGETAVRLEDGFLITASGPERLTNHLV